MKTTVLKELEWNAQIVVVCLIVGTAIGVAAGLTEIRAHDYRALGFGRNLLLALRETVFPGTVAGLKLGAIWVAINLAVGLLARPIRRLLEWVATRLDLPISGNESIWALCLTLLGGLGLFCVSIRIWGVIGLNRAGLIVAATLAWYVGYRLTEGAKARRALLYALTPGGAIMLSSFDLEDLSQVLSLEMAGALLLCLAILAVLHLTCGLLSARNVSAARSVAAWVVLLGLLVAPLGATYLFETPALNGLQVANPKNVIVIGIDTLRFDRVSPSTEDSGTRSPTPNLAALAERGTQFSNAISQAPWTLPAFSSIMTGKYPRQHGAISLTGGGLAKSEVTLAEVLRESGYQTAGVVSQTFLKRRFGLDQGFDSFRQDQALGNWKITSWQVTNQAIDAITKMEGSPFFLFVHYFDPHNEYRDHENWDWADDYDGWLSKDWLDIQGLRMNRHLLGDDETRYLVDLYDEEVAFTDRQVGRLLDFVSAQELDGETAVVVVSDHGEEFMEHGWLGHTITLYDELIRVPLIAVLPTASKPRKAAQEVVETRAIFHTLLDYLGIEWNREPEGLSFLPLQRSDKSSDPQADERYAFSEVWLPTINLNTGKRVQISSVRTHEWKYVRDHRRDWELLIDLAADPMELQDAKATHPAQADRLRKLLDVWLQTMPRDPTESDQPVEEIDQELLEELKALGYL